MIGSMTLPINAVGAIRVSSLKQGINGDSPEDQQRQIEQYAASRGVTISKFFVFLESASKAQQPMQEVVDYCKNKKHGVQQVIIKSIDRFTRGGSEFYNTLKNQLDDAEVSLVDIYGVIGGQKVNTLEHLGVEYKWSVYSPTKKSEILEAERAKDEVRDIQTRMIGAQIRYARMGYWVRRPIYGYTSEHIETREGKRSVLRPHETEAPLVVKLFELRARGTLDDSQIVERLNTLGFKTRERHVRDREDRTKIIRTIGGDPLTLKTMWGMIENPVYAGINPEKWTQGQPVKCQFDGLVSIELWNAANHDKYTISEGEDGIRITRRKVPEYLANKGARNEDFPYKRIVMCPMCNKPLYGSASRGRHGGYFPAYHCNRGHYFRVPKKEFDEAIENFVKNITVAPEYIDALVSKMGEQLDKQLITLNKEAVTIDLRIANLKEQIRQSVDKIRFLSSATAIKYIEEDIEKMEEEITELSAKRETLKPQKPSDIEKAGAFVRHFLEHLDELLLQYENSVQQARYFGVLFNTAPTFSDIQLGTPDISKITGVNSMFSCLTMSPKTRGWDGGIRTPECWYQKPVPYHLATSHYSDCCSL